MLLDVPECEFWMNHITQRVKEGIEVELLARDTTPILRSAKVFFPYHVTPDELITIDPESRSLRDLVSGRSSVREAWMSRPDLFDEAAVWLKANFSGGERLVFEAGYSKLGDKALENRPHFVYSDHPFLYIKIEDASDVELISLLRWSRSWRVLGVCAMVNESDFFKPMNTGVFFCDALECDSLIMVRVARLTKHDRDL